MDELFNDAHPLVQSLRNAGMETPMVVSDQEDGTYVIIDGNRRLQSAQYLGWKVVLCRVFQKLDHGDMLSWKFKFNNIRKAWTLAETVDEDQRLIVPDKQNSAFHL
jgi:hypothetical protein